LGFKGGKAIATTVGVWIGLTILEAPIVMMTLLTYWFFIGG
jgi:glycerol-3-phosphate acyltransferase PlsY